MMPVLDPDGSKSSLADDGCTLTAIFDRCVTTVSDDYDLGGFAAAWALDTPGDGPVMRRSVTGSIGAGPDQVDGRTIWTWFGRPPSANLSCSVKELRGVLSRDECERLDRFRFMEDRWSYAASHAGVRLLLGNMLDCAPADVALVAGKNGKPLLDPDFHGELAANRIHFNMAHSRGMVAIALAGAPVGIDVEPVRSLPDMREMIALLMAPETLEIHDRFDASEDRITHFFRNWTLGEAYIKATGEGVDQGLASFAFSADGQPLLTRCTPGWGPGERWAFGTVSRAKQLTPASRCNPA